MIGDKFDNDIYPAMELGMRIMWVKQGFSVYHRLDEEKDKSNHNIMKQLFRG